MDTKSHRYWVDLDAGTTIETHKSDRGLAHWTGLIIFCSIQMIISNIVVYEPVQLSWIFSAIFRLEFWTYFGNQFLQLGKCSLMSSLLLNFELDCWYHVWAPLGRPGLFRVHDFPYTCRKHTRRQNSDHVLSQARGYVIIWQYTTYIRERLGKGE
jgi:hypothetical protein